jgi:RNA polymerase sigma-70 factor (ECF subfamily)
MGKAKDIPLHDDTELVRQMLSGDERAFTAFFEAYFPRIYRFALPRLGRNADVAKDVVQSTLIKAMRRLGDWRGEAALFTWLCQICRREIAGHVRSQRRHSDKVVLIEDSEEVRAALEAIEAPPGDDPLRRCDGAELKRLVHAVLDRLPSRYGEALEWKYVEGRSVEEIGDRLGIGHTAAQSLLARARVAFRDGLEAVFGASAADVLAGLEA